jgi:hypothetical protein
VKVTTHPTKKAVAKVIQDKAPKTIEANFDVELWEKLHNHFTIGKIYSPKVNWASITFWPEEDILAGKDITSDCRHVDVHGIGMTPDRPLFVYLGYKAYLVNQIAITNVWINTVCLRWLWGEKIFVCFPDNKLLIYWQNVTNASQLEEAKAKRKLYL